jgi:hypothetical protein
MPADEVTQRIFSFFPPMMLKSLVGEEDRPPLTTPYMEYFESVSLFLDVSGFTKLSEALAAQGPALGCEGLAKHLNSYMGQLIRIVSGSGGGASARPRLRPKLWVPSVLR